MAHTRLGRWVIGIAVFGAMAVLLSPLVFTIYRAMIFDTIPRDDYATFLLWVARSPQGAIPDSPYCYRLLTMLAALPFHMLLPVLQFSGQPQVRSVEYMQATAAIAALSYVCAILAGFLSYATARAQCGLGRRDAVLAGVLLFALCWHGQMFGIDSVSIAVLAAALWALPSLFGFAAVALLSVGFNEKIGIVLVVWLSARLVCDRGERAWVWPRWLAALAAVAVYAAILKTLNMPGNEYQTQPLGYLATLRDNLAATASMRGFLLNLLPTAILAAIATLGWGRRIGPFRAADTLTIPALVLVSLILTQMFQMGRIVMHAAPLFVIPAAAAFGRWADRAER